MTLEAEPLFLDMRAVLALYADIAQTIGVGIGGIDESKLGGAIGRPCSVYDYSDPRPGIAELAACTAYTIAKAHAFGDGNKRTALASMDLFLEQNGWELAADGMAIAKQIEAAVANEITEEQFTVWVVEHARQAHSHG